MRKLLIRNPSSTKKFDPTVVANKSRGSFRDAEFWKAMDSWFGTDPDEKILGLEISEEGITATFE